MKFKLFKYFSATRQVWLAAFTLVALIMLVVIQISWIIKAATLEEQIFSHRVSMAMKEVRDEIGKKIIVNSYMKDYIIGNSCPDLIRQNKIAEIDSMIKVALVNYDIKLEYDFFINNSVTSNESLKTNKSHCYIQNMNGFVENETISIGMHFPRRNQFLMEQMKGWFMLSILFIAFIATSFIITFRLFLRERAQMVRTTDFINNMVHEFQTPLANVKLATNLIRKKIVPSTDVKVSEYTDVILRENHKMEGNVQEILKIACLDQNASQHADIDIHDIIKTLADHSQYRATERDGAIETKLNATHSVIYGIEEHFTQLISNLIDNALKYSTDTPHIVIETSNKGKQLCITIADNGIGISQENLPHIFDKYYRVSTGNLHNVKGFGLGLAFVKKITDLYHGIIHVKSALGKGTTFEICLPVNRKN